MSIGMFLFNSDPKARTALAIAELARGQKHLVYFFGHCVRNYLFGEPVLKYSLVSSISPDRLAAEIRQAQLANHPHLKGLTYKIGFGQLKCYNQETQLEVIIYVLQKRRAFNGKEESITLSHKNVFISDVPSHVSLKEDALSRAFTIETIYYDPFDNELIDCHGGIEDIRKGRLRVVPNTDFPYSSRIKENPDLLLRSIAYCSKYNLIPEESINLYNESHRDLVKLIPRDIVRKHLKDCLEPCGLETLTASGMMDFIIPNFSHTDKCKTTRLIGPKLLNDEEDDDLYNHIILTLDKIQSKHGKDASIVLKMAALLHEISRPTDGDESVNTKSAAIARRILSELGYASKFVDKVTRIILYLPNAFEYSALPTQRQLKVLDNTKDIINDLCYLAWAKCSAIKSANNSISMMSQAYRNYASKLYEKPFLTTTYLENNFTGSFESITDKEKKAAYLRDVSWDVRAQQINGHLKNESDAFGYIKTAYGISRKQYLLPAPKPKEVLCGACKRLNCVIHGGMTIYSGGPRNTNSYNDFGIRMPDLSNLPRQRWSPNG